MNPKPAKNAISINFKLNKKDNALCDRVINRLRKSTSYTPAQLMAVHMNLAACHNHGARLDFRKLLEFDDFNFLHDIGGISGHLDRITGALRNCFSPRCSRPSAREKRMTNRGVEAGYLPEKYRIK